MKVYVQEHSWRGMIVLTAMNIDEARQKMIAGDYYNYDENVEIQEFELENFAYCNLGDC